MMIEMMNLLLEVSIDDLKRQFVETEKISKEAFQAICNACSNKSAYVTWMCKKCTTTNPDEHILDAEKFATNAQGTVEKWKEALQVFEKYKQSFPKKDINQIKTADDLVEFFRTVDEVKQKAAEKEAEKSRASRIDQFKIGSVVCNGGKGYLIYKLPQGHEENRDVSIELGKTEHESLGSRGWCTASGQTDSYWKQHIHREDLYIIINPRDKKFDKYQIQFGYYDAKPFWVGNDQPVGDDRIAQFAPIYQWLHEHEGRPIPHYIVTALEFQRGLENSNANLEDLKIADGIYKISSDMPMDSWARPLCVDIFGGGSYKLLMDVSRYLGNNYVFYFTQGNGTWMYTLTQRGQVLQNGETFDGLTGLIGTLNNVIENYASTATTNRAAKRLYETLKEICEDAHAQIPDRLRSIWEPDSFVSAEQCKKGVKGKGTYYIVPAGESVVRVFAEMGINGNIECSGGVGIVVQGHNIIVLKNVYEEQSRYHLIRYSDGYINPQDSYNPDVVYELYKALKEFDNNIIYPNNIQKIVNIREENSLQQYEIPTIGKATKIYKIPASEYQNLVPADYEVGYYRYSGYILLGFISKWQFTLTSSGDFILTGRWGYSGSASWIESVPGLGEVVCSLCEEYGIYYPDGLRTYLNKHPEVREVVLRTRSQRQDEPEQAVEEPVEQPQALTQSEPEQPVTPVTSQQQVGTEEPEAIKRLSIQRRLAYAESNDLLRPEAIHIADYMTARGVQRQMVININCLHGSWNDFEYSLMSSRTQIVGMAINWCQENNAHITDVYAWPNNGTWNGLLICVDNTNGNTVRVYRRLGYGMGASTRIYRNSNEWTLTI